MIDKIQRAEARSWVAGLNSSTGMASASSGGGRRDQKRGLRALRRGLWFGLLAIVCSTAQAAISLSHQEAMRIGRKIWQNECGGTVSGLTSWNAGENFASLGIGHFIWYPAGVRGPFEESFPPFVRYVEKRGAKLPELLLGRKSGACPWESRPAFLAAGSSQRMENLRTFLVDTIDLQADFMVERLRQALPKMLADAPAEERGKIETRFNRLANRAHGCYALIDYVNFKGEGVLETERYKGRGWGLLQVLEGMSDDSGASPLGEFADSAERVLGERVKNSPPERNEARWLPGWLKRVDTYR
ncbi:MAG TPA: hypothetical protein VH207_03745 [Chthoniobacterales bacterium]|nr:hypothetical protein [Chthoniobacterales bacterium]